MSNFFLSSQLFTSNDLKELRISNYIFRYQYYNSALDGNVSWETWTKMSPKMIEMFIDSQKHIKETQNTIVKNKGLQNV